MSEEINIERIPEPTAATKRPITEKQRKTLEKARIARAVKKQRASEEKKDSSIISLPPMKYLFATTLIGSVALVGYYLTRQGKNSAGYQEPSPVQEIAEKVTSVVETVVETVAEKIPVPEPVVQENARLLQMFR